MTRPTVRWASTWSGPFWASSSMTKIAVSGQDLLWVTASTIRPRARSLLATQAWGVNVPGRVPVVWSSPRLITMKRGSVPFLLEFLELLDEGLGVVGVAAAAAGRLGETPKSGAHVPDQARHGALDLERAVGLADPPAVLAVAAIAQTRAGTGVPEIARGGVGQVAVVVVVDSGPARVGQGPVAGDVIGVVGHRRPGMAVGRDVPVAVQVVQQHELLGQLVMVGRHVAAEHHQRRVAVAPGQVAEDLVVGAVLLDDVEDVLDRRRARRPWWGSAVFSGCGASVSSLSEYGQFL